MKRIALYCRVSSREQVLRGYGIDDQERRCKEYIHIYYSEENPNVTLFREEGVSARNIDRPELQKVIDLIKKKEIDVLVVYTYDRLTRRLKDFISLLELMEKNNVVLDSVKEQFNTSSATGRMFVHMIVAMAEWEEDTIAERTYRGLDESAKQGNFCKAKAPFGYEKMKCGKRKTLAIINSQAEIIKKIFNLIVDDGFSAFAVAKKLKEEVKEYGFWSDKRVQSIVANKIYYGTFEYHGVEYENQVPSIVSYETWTKANTILNDLRHNAKYQYFYKGYIICDKCNKKLTGHSANGCSSRYLYYYCPDCKQYFSQNTFEKKIDNQFSNIIKTEEMVKVFEQCKGGINKIQTEIEKTRNCIAKGIISESFGNEEIKDAERRLKRLIEKTKKQKVKATVLNYIDLDYDEKRKFLSKYVCEIRADMTTKNFVVIFWIDVIINEEFLMKMRQKLKK